MVKQTNKKIVRDIDKFNEQEFSAASEYVSQLFLERLPIQTENQFNDLIASLTDKRENRRARCSILRG